ncbi:hypothetical protein [Rhodococcus tibetensis]|uniref:Uncharacterized protein n=1 Tax=Rhodococcus tibetensis TaxID=2965064 RepID=A0ABT1QFP8_9NOCA|nr:hypothetical protein [Rhodococcus sp. FXJ9.536]MCQ4119905.1 hypothetical protein [Rhodococcus sp. FXJ9.536]
MTTVALHLDLKVNGKTIGTFEAVNIPFLGTEGKARYRVDLRRIKDSGEVQGTTAMVDHNPDDGAWELLRKSLEQTGFK